jgi:predicted PurR-regulated permease PerM
VRLHPLAIVVSLTAGTVLAGILGALFVVPLVACISSAVRSLVGQAPDAAGLVAVEAD